MRFPSFAPSRAPSSSTQTRLQASGGGTGAVQRRYTGAWDVLRSAYAQGGVSGLYQGAGAAMIRVAMGSGVQLAIYDWAKATVASLGVPPGLLTTVGSAAVSGAVVSIGTLRTRLRGVFADCKHRSDEPHGHSVHSHVQLFAVPKHLELHSDHRCLGGLAGILQGIVGAVCAHHSPHYFHHVLLGAAQVCRGAVSRVTMKPLEWDN